MMQELFAKEGGLCGGKGGSMHIADLDRGMLGANGIVGGGPPLVVGAALSAKTLKTGTVAVSFTGDGGSNQGTTFEALNMAVVLQLPAVFVFENNQYGEGTGFSYHCGSGDIAGRARGFGMPAVKVNGDDFFAVHEAAGEAVERARQGGGPSAIEVDTCRFYGHHSGDAQLYRGKDEVRRLREERDCLKHFRRRVGEAALLETAELDAVEAEVAALIDRAVETARAGAAARRGGAPDRRLCLLLTTLEERPMQSDPRTTRRSPARWCLTSTLTEAGGPRSRCGPLNFARRST